jgi:hypothetical protein
MPYRALTRQSFPLFSSEEVLARLGIRVYSSQSPLRDAEQTPRTLVEFPANSDESPLRVLAAFADVRPSNEYHRLTVGLEGVARFIPLDRGPALAVLCRANRDNEQIGGKFLVQDPTEARDLLLSFIEFAGKWIDPLWFDGYTPTRQSSHTPMLGNKSRGRTSK